jgi:hypothetical protein
MKFGSSARDGQRNMKKATTKKTDPLDRQIDFTRFGPVRRNAFAGSGEEGGPGLLALWEMPQLTTDAVLLRRGRPRKGKKQTHSGPSRIAELRNKLAKPVTIRFQVR